MKETTVSLTSETTTPNKVESMLDLRRYADAESDDEVADAMAVAEVHARDYAAKERRMERALAHAGDRVH